MNTLKYKDFIGSVAFSEADGVFKQAGVSINSFIRTAVEKQIAAML